MRHHEIKLCDFLALVIFTGGVVIAWKTMKWIYKQLERKLT